MWAALKANQDGVGNNIVSTYETKANASSKLTEAKSYADSAVSTAINNVMVEVASQDTVVLAEAQKGVEALRAEMNSRAQVQIITWEDND